MIKPRAHQAEFMQFHKRNPHMGSLAWHGMGLGKTLSSLWLVRDQMAMLRQLGVIGGKFMVICPKSAVPTWKVECHKNTPDIYRDMLIYPYSQLHSAIRAIKHWDIRKIIFDESHYLKSPETNRSEALAAFLHELGSTGHMFKDGRVIMLTGTPMPNSAAELYTTWAICASKDPVQAAAWLRDTDRYTKWKKTFSKKKEQTWEVGKNRKGGGFKKHGTKWEGVDNENMLQQLLAPVVHYKRVEDCIDLPEKEEIAIDLGLPDDKLLADANIETPEAYMALVERLARAKTPHMLDWVRDYLAAGDQQLLVFAMNRHPIEELTEKFNKDARMITGSETAVERATNLKDFQEGKFRVLAMTYKCGAESLNLQNAFVSLYHGYPWHDGAVKQAIARTYRSGQGKRTLHYFLTSGVNDQRILSLVRAKEEATTRVENLMLKKQVKVELPTLDDLI